MSAPRPPRGALARWAPVVLWAICISWFSTGAFSGQSTHRYIDPALRWLFGDISIAEIRFAHAVIRKSAHVVEYAVLAFLLGRALSEPGERISGRLVLRVVLSCAAYASLDELHQTFERGRGGSPIDVGIDTGGALLGSLLLVGWRRLTGRPSTSRT